MEEESRQRQSRMDKGEPYMSIQPAEDPDGKFQIKGVTQEAQFLVGFLKTLVLHVKPIKCFEDKFKMDIFKACVNVSS